MAKSPSFALNEFLNSSSIHGLRYIVASRSPLFKLLWLASIIACMTAASVIIYFNVANWSNTPAVVTKVNPSLAKDKELMPMVTVCPRYPNLNRYLIFGPISVLNAWIISLNYFDWRLLFNLASMYPEVAEENGLVQELTDMLLGDLVAIKMEETRLTDYYDHYLVKTMLKPCQNDTTNSSECRFILLLAGIAKKIIYFDLKYVGVEAYIKNSAMAKQDVTLQGLENYVENYYGFVIDDEKQLPVFMSELKVLIRRLACGLIHRLTSSHLCE